MPIRWLGLPETAAVITESEWEQFRERIDNELQDCSIRQTGFSDR